MGLEREDLRKWLTEGLARRDRLIVVLYYYEQITMKEIGRALGCSESRVSQRLDSILDCLRARLTRVGVGALE
jgi:RNA polymerase sigma factor for flagellar operon FliA